MKHAFVGVAAVVAIGLGSAFGTSQVEQSQAQGDRAAVAELRKLNRELRALRRAVGRPTVETAPALGTLIEEVHGVAVEAGRAADNTRVLCNLTSGGSAACH